MSFLPRALARRTPSSATALARSTPLATPSASSFASSSRRSYADEAPSPAYPGLGKGRLIPDMEETRFPKTLWSDIHQDILSQLPPPSIYSKPIRPIPEPKAPIVDASIFLKTVGRGLQTKVLAKVPDLTWEQLFQFKGDDWGTKAGLEVMERKYLMWCCEKYRQGWDPRAFKTATKKPKRFRRLGDVVQDNIRMKWSHKLDVGHAPRPWGMKATYRAKKE